VINTKTQRPAGKHYLLKHSTSHSILLYLNSVVSTSSGVRGRNHDPGQNHGMQTSYGKKQGYMNINAYTATPPPTPPQRFKNIHV
jgi:hypothetical protein